MNRRQLLMLVSTSAALLVSTACLWPQSLKKVGTIDLPGPKGQRFDYLTTDDEDHYLLSAHLGPGILYIIDLRHEQADQGRSRRAWNYRAGIRGARCTTVTWPS
jgi:hypothetical protein